MGQLQKAIDDYSRALNYFPLKDVKLESLRTEDPNVARLLYAAFYRCGVCYLNQSVPGGDATTAKNLTAAQKQKVNVALADLDKAILLEP